MLIEGRRKVARWQVKRQVRMRLEGAFADVDCVLEDINFKGMRVSLAMKLQEDVFLKLHMVMSDGCEMDVEVWVAWHKTRDGRNVYGLYFTKIKDQDKEKIYQFIRGYCPGQLAKHWWEDLKEERKEEKMNDRRVFERFPARVSLRFLEVDRNKEGESRTEDICAKGIGFFSKDEMFANTHLELWLNIKESAEPYYARGEVAWSEPVRDGGYRVGVSLEKADLVGLSRALRAG